MALRRELGALVQRGLDRHLRLGVTGLSRAGKTAFITSLVHQLHHAGAHLEFFRAARDGRIHGARRMTQTHLELPTFPYEAAIDSLEADEPIWPEPTRGISEMRLAIRFQPRQRPLRFLSDRYLGGRATLFLDIVDYPGEWLLDLPLLNQSYLEWSGHVAQWYGPERRALAAPWLAELERVDWCAPASDNRLAEIAALYTQSLHAAKKAGLSYIQPGRFVMPGDLDGAPVLQFFPAVTMTDELRQKTAMAPRNSAFRTLETRFEYYKRHIVQPFYLRHFARLDRQIVLIDCLGPLNRGAEAFEDVRLTMEEILRNFHYGPRDLLRRLFSPRIDRLVFAASKSDHVTADQHPRLLALLRALIRDSEQGPRYEAVPVHSLCLAAIRASEEVVVQASDGPHPALRGLLMNGEPITFYPGEVPDRLPARQLWENHQFDFLSLRPPRATPGTPFPHLRMDSALELLLGDKLR